MRKIQCWCRTNAMLAISLLAAAATAFFVPPDRDYLGYYDLKTLSCLIHFVKVVLRNFPAIVHNKPLDFIAHSFLAGGAEVDFHPIGRVSDFLHNIGLLCFLYGQRGSVCGGAGFIAHRLSFQR